MKLALRLSSKVNRWSIFSKQTKYIHTTLIYTPSTHINAGLLNKDVVKNVVSHEVVIKITSPQNGNKMYNCVFLAWEGQRRISINYNGGQSSLIHQEQHNTHSYKFKY
jgi:hypothetical protein